MLIFRVCRLVVVTFADCNNNYATPALQYSTGATLPDRCHRLGSDLNNASNPTAATWGLYGMIVRVEGTGTVN